jgi:hypothetical protein
MMNEVILTLTDSNGNASTIDLYENEKMHLNYKFTDLTNFSSVGSYSQEFRIPASATNVDFFGAIFNVNFNGWFDFRKKVIANLTVNTIPIASGHIQVKKLYWQSGKLFEFEVVFFGEVPNLSRLLNEKKLRDIEGIVAGDLDYDLLHTNVETPPNDNTILTLCDKWNLTASNPLGQPVYSTVIAGQPTYKPLYVGHLTPAVKAYYLFDQILKDAGVQWASASLLDMLDNVYVPFVNGQYLSGENGMNNITSNVGLAANVNNVTITASNNTISLYTNFTEYEDQGNNWSSGIYTVPYSAEYTFRVWINGQATRNNSNTDLSNTILTVLFELNGSGSISAEQVYFVPQTGTPTSTNIIADFLRTLTLQEGDVMRIKCSLSTVAIGTGALPSVDVDFYGNANIDYTGTGVELVSVSTQLYGNQPVYMSFNAPDMKQIDFITSIQKMFNLAFVPDRTLPNTLRIEPLVEYIGSGNTLDWTEKLDLSKDITYYPTTDLQKAKFTFTYTEDSDYYNNFYKDNGHIFGSYEVTENDFEVINEFATGEEKVELAFAPTPSRAVENTDVVVPRFINGEGQFVQPKPRILYYFADFFVNMYDEVSGDVIQTAVKCLNNYSTMNASVGDSDLNFAPEVPLHTIIAPPYDNLYNRWWRNYYRELYDGQARILEGMFALTLNDIFTFQWSDKIWIVDSWWRVLDIEGYVVGEQDMTKVKLIRILDIDNDCDILPITANLDQTINWERPNGDPAVVTEDCCRRFGYYWNSAKNNCFSVPNIGTRSFITSEAPTLAPTRFGAPVNFGASVSQPVRSISSDYVVTNFDRTILLTDLVADIDVYLPSAQTTRGTIISIKLASDDYGATLHAYTGQKIESAITYTIKTSGSVVTLVSDGSNWKIDSENDNTITWTIDFMSSLTATVFAPYDLIINKIDNVKNSPVITITDDGSPYTLGTNIAVGSAIAFTANTASVVNAIIERA